MSVPIPNLVGPETLDTVSIDGNCLYPPQPLGAGITTSPNVYLGGDQLKFSHAALIPDPVPGQKINPLIPLPCQPGNRISINQTNTTVHVNMLLPLVRGDLCQLLGTDRPFTGPFQAQGNVFIASQVLPKN
jgi:hypothetical protein